MTTYINYIKEDKFSRQYINTQNISIPFIKNVNIDYKELRKAGIIQWKYNTYQALLIIIFIVEQIIK